MRAVEEEARASLRVGAFDADDVCAFGGASGACAAKAKNVRCSARCLLECSKVNEATTSKQSQPAGAQKERFPNRRRRQQS